MPLRKDIGAARVAYVTGDDKATLEAVAKAHGFSAGHLRDVAAAERWTEKRREHRAKVEVRRLALAAEAVARETVEADHLGVRVAKRLLQKVDRALDRDEQAKAKARLPPSALLALANTAKAAVQALHAVSGDPRERPMPGPPEMSPQEVPPHPG